MGSVCQSAIAEDDNSILIAMSDVDGQLEYSAYLICNASDLGRLVWRNRSREVNTLQLACKRRVQRDDFETEQGSLKAWWNISLDWQRIP